MREGRFLPTASLTLTQPISLPAGTGGRMRNSPLSSQSEAVRPHSRGDRPGPRRRPTGRRPAGAADLPGAVADPLGQLPAVLASHRRQQTANVVPHPPTQIHPGEPARHPSEHRLHLALPLVDFSYRPHARTTTTTSSGNEISPEYQAGRCDPVVLTGAFSHLLEDRGTGRELLRGHPELYPHRALPSLPMKHFAGRPSVVVATTPTGEQYCPNWTPA